MRAISEEITQALEFGPAEMAWRALQPSQEKRAKVWMLEGGKKVMPSGLGGTEYMPEGRENELQNGRS